MKYLKEHTLARIALIALFFILGMVLMFVGWKMTGKLGGLGLMMLGIASLLLSLYIYNKAYQ